MSLKSWALVFGVVFLLLGILGFLPRFAPDARLLGLFTINPIHNFVHLVTGIIGLFAASKMEFARLYFKVFGIIYAVVTVLGLTYMADLYYFNLNAADHILHALTAVIALYLGFIKNGKKEKAL